MRAITRETPWPLSETPITQTAQSVFEEVIQTPFSVRLLGLSISNLQSSTFEEMTLF